MWRNNFQFQRQGFRGGRNRPIKTMPKNELFAAIAQSKQIQRPVPVVPSTQSAKHTFADFPLAPVLQDNIKRKGFMIPTPVQDQAIPAILAQRDVIGTAHTGTGKTAAFVIPLIQKTVNDKNQRTLVVTPTRELAFQIHMELRDLARGLSIRSALLTGGTSEWRQKEDIKRGPHVVIATPGRLKDFIQSNVLRLSGFRNVVLDEADRMVDVGFINDIKYFISLLPHERQSLCFSATISSKVRDILRNFVRNPFLVTVESQNIVSTIAQDVIRVSDHSSKEDMLHDMLKQKEFEKVLVFGRTKHGVQKLSDTLNKRGVRSGAIHGNKRQNQRQHVLNQFINSEIQILLATDVASRGLDIPNVSHVINYDLPETMDDYIHRIGRTGRANKQGIALTFVEA